MIEIGNTLVSLDLLAERFVCDIARCKGICCEEGDSGAPLELDELEPIEAVLPKLLPMLSAQAREVIERQGIAYTDEEGDLVTSIVGNRECVFAYRDDQGVWQCAIEKAYEQGLTPFRKPVSCHLYPVRLRKRKNFLAVEYHRWEVCSDACRLGAQLKVPVYKFLKDPLIRRFGQEWYQELEKAATAFYDSEYYKKLFGNK
ncbi:MAG: DUF3109 family protein [Paludibacteraceae bacterium]|nr:DUF3109 family protein [Paludibacteraceae bacterium]